MALIRDDLAALGIEFQVATSERALVESGGVDAALRFLEERGLIYNGVLEPPKGKLPDDWEPRPQTLFRATRFGDDVDRPLRKSDGSWTYFAADIAYHLDKFRRGFPLMIDVWGADHGGYVKRMQAAVAAVTDGAGTLDVKLCQLVNLLEGGEPVRMSKRAGTFVTLRDVVDRVGKRRLPLHHADAQERRAARLRLSQGHRAVAGQSGLLRAICPRPLPLGDAPCRVGVRRSGRRRRGARGRRAGAP